MIIPSIVCAVIALCVVVFLARPHLLPHEVSLPGITSKELLPIDADSLELHKQRYVQVLRDLELDWQTQKIAPDDYEKTRAPLERELAAVLKALKQR